MKRVFHHPQEDRAGKRYWRGLEELSNTPEFQEWLQREFPAGAAELETDGYVRIAPLFRTTRTLQRFLAESGLRERDDESHRSTDEVDVSDIAFLTEEDIGLIDTARKSRTRAVQLLEFVVRSVMHEDGPAFEEPSVPCECGQSHSAYRAAWLVPLHDRKWSPTGEGRSTVVSAESLAVLVAEQPDVAALLGGDEGAQFLEALGISAADFQLRAIATKESDRLRLVRSMSELARAAGGDIDRVEMLATELHDHPHGTVERVGQAVDGLEGPGLAVPDLVPARR